MKLKQNPSYLSQTNTNCLKGILAICVLICHVWSNIASSISMGGIGKYAGVIFTAVGYLSVSLFFFLSGYGLMIQYQKKGKSYLNGFFRKRFFPLYLLCIILILFYSAVRLFLGESISVWSFLQSFFFGETVISKGWYLQSILLWYLFFFISFRFFSKEKTQILSLFILFAVYIAICLVLNLYVTWYEGTLSLPIGVLWAKYKDKIAEYLNLRYTVHILLILGAFAVLFLLGNFTLLPVFLKIISKCLSAVFFAIAVVISLRILPIENFITKFLGKIYLEIYVIHGFCLMFWHSKYIYINNALLYSVLVFLSSLILACILKPVFYRILQLGKRKKYE